MHEDIVSGQFKLRIQRYKNQLKVISTFEFKNFGEVPDDMSFEQLVSLYEKIRSHDEKNRKMQQMIKQGSISFNWLRVNIFYNSQTL